MAPVIDCRFYKTPKERYGHEYDVVGALLIATTIREKTTTRKISRNNENTIISRLRRNIDLFKNFKDSLPMITWDNLPDMEQRFRVRISILIQPIMREVPKVIRHPSVESGTDIFLITRKKLSTADPLRYPTLVLLDPYLRWL